MIFAAQGANHVKLTKEQYTWLNNNEIELVNYTDATCNCGYGCQPHTCPQSKRHWFLLPEWMAQNPSLISKTENKLFEFFGY